MVVKAPTIVHSFCSARRGKELALPVLWRVSKLLQNVYPIVLLVLGTEPRALGMLTKHANTELRSQFLLNMLACSVSVPLSCKGGPSRWILETARLWWVQFQCRQQHQSKSSAPSQIPKSVLASSVGSAEWSERTENKTIMVSILRNIGIWGGQTTVSRRTNNWTRSQWVNNRCHKENKSHGFHWIKTVCSLNIPGVAHLWVWNAVFSSAVWVPFLDCGWTFWGKRCVKITLLGHS